MIDEHATGERFRAVAGTRDERQRRVWAAAEARSHGRGGIAAVARASGMAETIGPQGLVESHAAVLAHGGRVVALGKLAGAPVSVGASPRQAMVLVEWESPEAFQGLLEDPGYADLHPLRENGTLNYLWWTYDRLEVPAPAAERGTRLYRRVLSAHNATRRRTCGAA